METAGVEPAHLPGASEALCHSELHPQVDAA